MKEVLKKKSPLQRSVTGIYIKKFGKEIPDEVFCLILAR